MIQNQCQIDIIEVLKQYRSDLGDDPLISDLGFLNGRVVQIADLTDDNRNSLRATLQQQLDTIRPDLAHKSNKVISDYLPSIKTMNEKIGSLLNESRKRYESQFQFINENTETKFIKHQGISITYVKSDEFDDFGPAHFQNKFTQDSWDFIENSKEGCNNLKNVFMTNFVIHQYEHAFKAQGIPMTLPKKITRKRISNSLTNSVIKQFQGQHDSDEFKEAFLNSTVNGKSTVQIAKEFGLNIDNLEVVTSKNGFFDVVIHVSPDPAVYK